MSLQLLGFQHPQNSKLLNQRMERSNQEQEQLRHQLGLTQSAFETWLFFQEATARRLAEQLPKPDKKEETFQDPQRSKRWEAGLPFRVGCKNNQKKTNNLPKSAHNLRPPGPKSPVEDLSQELVNRGNWFRRNMASGSGLQPWRIIIKFLASFEAWSQN